MDTELKELFTKLVEAQTKSNITLELITNKLNELIEVTKKPKVEPNQILNKNEVISKERYWLESDFQSYSESPDEIARNFFYNSFKQIKTIEGIKYDFIQKSGSCSRNGLTIYNNMFMGREQEICLIIAKHTLTRKDIETALEDDFPKFFKIYIEYQKYKVRYAFASFLLSDDVIQFAKEKGIILLQRSGEVFESIAA